MRERSIPHQLVSRDAQVPEDGADSPRPKVTRAVIRNRSSIARSLIDPNVMTSLCTLKKSATATPQSSSQLPISHTATTSSLESSEVATSDTGSCCPSSTYESMKACATSWSIEIVSSGVSAHARQPGSAGTSPMYLSGSVDSEGSYRTAANLSLVLFRALPIL